MVATTEISQNILSMEQIKTLFPNEWVLLGNPEYQNMKILKGTVILHHKDKRELAYEAREKNEWRQIYESATTIYTGEFPKNRRIVFK
jgi:hypothetical protein